MKKFLILFPLLIFFQQVSAELDQKKMLEGIKTNLGKRVDSHKLKDGSYDNCINANYKKETPLSIKRLYCSCIIKEISQENWLEYTENQSNELLVEKFKKIYQNKNEFCSIESNYLKYENNLYVTNVLTSDNKSRLEKAMKDNLFTWIIVIAGIILALRVTITAIFKKEKDN